MYCRIIQVKTERKMQICMWSGGLFEVWTSKNEDDDLHMGRK